jgi:hypothetical protein
MLEPFLVDSRLVPRRAEEANAQAYNAALKKLNKKLGD